MSILSYLNPQFISYLYDNNIKISIYESGDNLIISHGFFGFLHKYKKKYITRLNYIINNINNTLSLRWDGDIKENEDKEEKIFIKSIENLIIFYVLYVIGKNKNISLTNIQNTQNDSNNFDDILIKNEKFSSVFLRNYINNSKYILKIEEYLNPCNLYGNFYLKKIDPKSSKICVDFTTSYNKLYIDLYTKDVKDYELIEVIILHIISKKNEHDNEIVIKISSKDIELYNVLSSIGFNISDSKEFNIIPISSYTQYSQYSMKNEYNILTSKYVIIRPYIERKWKYYN